MIKKIYKFLLIVFLLSLLGFALYSYLNQGIIYFLMQGDLAQVLNYLNDAKGWAIFIFVLLIIVEVIFAPVPPFILYVGGGVVFGSFYGGTLAFIGNLLGAALAFAIARHWGREYIEKKVSEKTRNKFDKFSEKYGGLAIFVLRINPFTSSDIFSYIGGLTKMKFWKFILGTAFALAPAIYFQSYLGESITSNPALMKWFMIFGSLYVLGFVGILLYVKFRKKFKQAN